MATVHRMTAEELQNHLILNSDRLRGLMEEKLALELENLISLKKAEGVEIKKSQVKHEEVEKKEPKVEKF